MNQPWSYMYWSGRWEGGSGWGIHVTHPVFTSPSTLFIFFKMALYLFLHIHFNILHLYFYIFLLFFPFIFISWRLITILWFLPSIDMNQPWIYMCSPSWTPHPPPSPSHPSGSLVHPVFTSPGTLELSLCQRKTLNLCQRLARFLCEHSLLFPGRLDFPNRIPFLTIKCTGYHVFLNLGFRFQLLSMTRRES